MTPRNVTAEDALAWAGLLPQSTPAVAEMEDPEQWRLYRLCPCGECDGTGKAIYSGMTPTRCKVCRGEGRTLDLVATCGTPEAVGVALVTLAGEGEWDECPFGLMHRPAGEKGVWKLKPWGPSARNVSDAGRTLAQSRRPIEKRGGYQPTASGPAPTKPPATRGPS